jgi:ribonuclease-3
VATSPYATLETRLGHRFAAAALLEQALTHRSFGASNNERLEFLGDGVLGCAVAHELYARFPRLTEGKMTLLRAGLVREEALAEVGRSLGLEPLLRVGSNASVNRAILADAVEAVFGALFLDAGYPAARAAVLSAFASLFATLDPDASAKDAKTQLQEVLQSKDQPPPDYQLIEEAGPAHQRSFKVECLVGGMRALGQGTSKKAAEQQAAQAMLDKLGR